VPPPRVPRNPRLLRVSPKGPVVKWGVWWGTDWYRVGGPDTPLHTFTRQTEAEHCASVLNRCRSVQQVENDRGQASVKLLVCACPNPENRMTEHLSKCPFFDVPPEEPPWVRPCPLCPKLQVERELIAERCVFAEKRVESLRTALHNLADAYIRESQPWGMPEYVRARELLGEQTGLGGFEAVLRRLGK
jgi:hypothetical protein